MPWTVSLAKKAARDLDGIPAADWPGVRPAIDGLADDPHRGDVRPLQGKDWKGYFSKRAGDFRIVLTLDQAARKGALSVAIPLALWFLPISPEPLKRSTPSRSLFS